jgi:hypothetical protein
MAFLLYHSAKQLYHPQSRGFTGFWYSGTVGTPENAFLLHNFFKIKYATISVIYEFLEFFQTGMTEKCRFAVPLCPAANFLKTERLRFEKMAGRVSWLERCLNFGRTAPLAWLRAWNPTGILIAGREHLHTDV